MTGVLINPGAGPVRASRISLVSALANMKRFVAEVGDGVTFVRCYPFRNDDGRWDFKVKRGRRSVIVCMPGVPYRVLTAENGWPPRLYVDGNSWWWSFAVGVAQDELGLGRT